MKCKIRGCKGKYKAKGMCNIHYNRGYNKLMRRGVVKLRKEGEVAFLDAMIKGVKKDVRDGYTTPFLDSKLFIYACDAYDVNEENARKHILKG